LGDQGQTVRQPIDVVKQPYVLDFLNLPDQKQLHESDIESAIIENRQPFSLELGKGFAFVARRYRVTTESQHFFIDLVFYNFLLKCFVLIDLKIGRVEHQHVGQMDMYLRILDDLKRGEGDNATVGLILCAEKDCCQMFHPPRKPADVCLQVYVVFSDRRRAAKRACTVASSCTGRTGNLTLTVPVTPALLPKRATITPALVYNSTDLANFTPVCV
jgi:hypothetical protein